METFQKVDAEMPRIKTAICLEKDLVDWIDAKVREGIYSSRSHAVRFALIQLRKKEVKEV